MIDAEFYFVVRGTDGGGEWVDTITASLLHDGACENGTVVDKAVPEWAAANPVKRIARFRVVELPEKKMAYE